MFNKSSIFCEDDEFEFKRAFIIHFLASMDAMNFDRNCQTGWKRHSPPVEDAACLADKAWEAWKETIGLA